MHRPITASMLYDLVQCPHRLFLDLHENPQNRDPENKFVQLLWEKGTAYEKEVIKNLQVPFTDLSGEDPAAKEKLTMEAIARGDPLIYGGCIRAGDILGVPDLLSKRNGGYVAGDIKSGSGFEDGSSDETDGKPKKHYAVQLGLYTDILERLGFSSGRYPYIWDINGKEVVYDLNSTPGPRTPQTLWQSYNESLSQAQCILAHTIKTLPAYSSTCKLCHWSTFCKHQLYQSDDLTLIPDLGRAKRDSIYSTIKSVKQFAQIDINTLISGKGTAFKGIGPDVLRKYHLRARLLADTKAAPILKKIPSIPDNGKELFFDIETDPMRDICYLHGFVERTGQDKTTERYKAFLAKDPTPEDEKLAFAQAWEYSRLSSPCTIYYYSKYERTWWRKLQKRYPDIATESQIEKMFDQSVAIDLYGDFVLPCTEWPTNDYSIKTLATYLGFKWRDPSPSGAASIEWYNRWIETGDLKIQQRILEYNEDDCIAMRVLLDGIRSLLPGYNPDQAIAV